MARKPVVEAPFAAFGALLDGYLRAGRRPDPNNREHWTDVAFARVIPGRDADSAGSSPRSVANWRNGTALPSEIEPILRALFGPLRIDGGADRETLRTVYVAARDARDGRILSAAEPDPVGEIFVPQGDKLGTPREVPEDDIAAADDPDVVQDHGPAIAQARALAELVARRDNQLSDGWGDLLTTARAMLAALDVPTADLPGRLGPAYHASVRLGSLLDQQMGWAKGAPEREKALDDLLARTLRDTVTLVAPMLRVFPGVRRRDGRLREFMRPEDWPAAQGAAREARAQEVAPDDDLDRIDDMAATGARSGAQGEKSRARLVGTMRNLLLAGATTVMLSGYANESPLVKRLSGFLVAIEREAGIIATGMAADVGAAVKAAVEKARSHEVGADQPEFLAPTIVARVWPPREPFVRWRDEVPGLAVDECPEMVTLPAGRFLMGAPEEEEGSNSNERPRHWVEVPTFAMGRCAVTFAQWDAAIRVGARLPRLKDMGMGRVARPVIDVTWYDAQSYCVWLNDRLGLAEGYRLPTEAEWEYACRAGTTGPFSFGATISPEQANYRATETYGEGKKGTFRGRTVPVGLLPANKWGLHEMHGNVSEWVAGMYRNGYVDAPVDGSVAVTGNEWDGRVLRGGCWHNNPQQLRSASRSWRESEERSESCGFRLARTPG